MEERYVSITEISKNTNISAPNIRRRAKKEQWKTKEESKIKGKRILFLFDSLPEDIKDLLNKTEETREAVEKTKESEAKETEEIKTNEEIKEQTNETVESNNEEGEIREKEISEVIKKLESKSVILMGKSGIGKTYILEKAVRILSIDNIVIHFNEPMTAKTLLLNITIAAEVPFGKSKEDAIGNLKGYNGKRIILSIDQLERMTPSAIEILDSLLINFKWFRFLGAGHLGNKKRYNSTWLKATGYILKPVGRKEIAMIIDKLWPEGDKGSKKTIVDEARGIPGNAQRMSVEARQGIMPEEEQKYLDATPVIMILATIGVAARIIGYGYDSTQAYIMGGIMATVFTGAFWIYRGYVSGWWGTKFNKKDKDKY